MIMNHCHWFLVFICGSLVSIVLMFISELVKYKVVNYFKEKQKPFVLMNKHGLQPVDEDSMSLSLSKTKVRPSAQPKSGVDNQGKQRNSFLRG